MTRSPGFARICLSCARWLLPWIAVLAVSISLAYVMGSALRGGSWTSDQPEVQALLSRHTAGAPSDFELSTIEPSGGKLGVVPITSPASTGRASPNGCCTWD